MPMKKSDKKAWVKALRSGEYKQTQDKLCDKGGFCCLGVAYDVLHDGDWELLPNGNWIPATGDERVRGKNGMYYPPGLGLDDCLAIASKNDKRVPFSEIADWIEENL